MSKFAEQIAAYESKRSAVTARMEEIMSKAGDEGATLDAEQQEEYDGLEQDLEAVGGHLKRLRALENLKAQDAKTVKPGETCEEASAARGGVVVRSPQLPPGIAFARMVKCIGLSRGNLMQAAQIAETNYKEDARIANVLKAAVAAGSTAQSTWAGPLVGDETSIFADFVAFLRPMTILGKFGTGNIPSLRQVPFRVALVGQTSGGSGYWVGEGKAKPLTKFDFERKTLEPLKVATIAVLTDEVIRDSSPSAEMIVRDQIAAALRERMDIDFIDPNKSAAAGVSPASITNGLGAVSSSGNDADAIREDIRALFALFIAANNAPTNGVWIMAATTALALSLMVNTLGQPEFPGITMSGGTLFGLPVIVSEYVPTDTAGSYVALVNASDIYQADEGGIMVDMSREASLEMDDAPSGASDSPPSPQSLVSLWQTNSVGFRAERTINWMRRRDSAVALLDSVNWGQPSS